MHEAAVLDAAEQACAVFGHGAADLFFAEAVVIGEIFHVGSNTYIRFHDISQFSSEKIRGGGMAGAAGGRPVWSATVIRRPNGE